MLLNPIAARRRYRAARVVACGVAEEFLTSILETGFATIVTEYSADPGEVARIGSDGRTYFIDVDLFPNSGGDAMRVCVSADDGG